VSFVRPIFIFYLHSIQCSKSINYMNDVLILTVLYITFLSDSRTPAVPFLFTVQHKVRFSPQNIHDNYDACKCRRFCEHSSAYLDSY
jgi:hypothetical protein